VAAYALVTLGILLGPYITTEPPPPSGQPAPDFSLPTSSGGAFHLDPQHLTQPVMVEFMHPDCGHCQNMADTLTAAYGSYGSRVRFVSVAIPLSGFQEWDATYVESFRNQHNHPWPYALSADGQAAADYGVSGTPTFFFVALDGTIASQQGGEMTAQQLDGALQALLEG
jgi:thiol-disulfide isomerase/thioredoxin